MFKNQEKKTNFYRKFHQKNHHQWEMPSLWLEPKVIFSKKLSDEAYKNSHWRETNFSKHYFCIIRRILTGEKWFSCDQCLKSFSASNDLIKHRRINTGEKQNSAKIILVSFIRRILICEKYFPCYQCPKSFAASNDLKKQRRIHIQGNWKKITYCLKRKNVNKISSNQLQLLKSIFNK